MHEKLVREASNDATLFFVPIDRITKTDEQISLEGNWYPLGFTKLEFKCNGNLQEFIQNKVTSSKTEEDYQKYINDSMRQFL